MNRGRYGHGRDTILWCSCPSALNGHEFPCSFFALVRLFFGFGKSRCAE